MKSTKTLLSYILFMISLQWKTVYALPRSCEKGEFACKNKACVYSSWKCDGENDCGDNSDEQDCDDYQKHRPCSASTNFRCKNKKCIPLSWTCDHVDDCGDESDESSQDGPLCVKSDGCARDDFKCAVSGACILRTFVCDGWNNCGKNDTSDEHDCKKRTCDPDEMKCDNGRCVSVDWRCDRSDDCGDASDEQNCRTATCPSNRFKCLRSGHCIRGEYKCDGAKDCLDGSDEIGCIKTTQIISTTAVSSKETVTTALAKAVKLTTVTHSHTASLLQTTTTIAPCHSYEFTCNSTKKCIHNTWLCDGEFDCENGEDENMGVCHVNTCNHGEFKCGNGQCIDAVYHCDGTNNCQDGSDEKNCSEIHVPCSKYTHHCNNSTKCIDNSLICNKKQDCPEGDDETESCGVNECLINNGGCSYKCRDLKIGYVCLCKPGYKLTNDNKTCVDINECLILGTCSQSCVNFKGSYGCQCNKGYVLDPVNKRICKAKSPIPYLLFSNHFDIREISINGHNYKPIIKDTRSVVAITVDVEKDMIYWADNLKKTICRATRTNDNMEVIVTNGIEKPEGLAVDWIGKKLFWTDSGYNRISVSNLDGSHVKVFINATEDQQFRALAVYPEKGFIYWSDWGKSPKIERANLDGTDRKTIVDMSYVTWASGIVVDNTLDRVYWVDLKERRICSCTLDGGDVRPVITHLNSPYQIAVFEEAVYWSDLYDKTLYKANKFNGKGLFQFNEHFFQPMDIVIYHPLVQTQIFHPCQVNNGGCSHLCFISQLSTFTCACPDFLNLSIDNKTCVRTGLSTTAATTAAATEQTVTRTQSTIPLRSSSLKTTSVPKSSSKTSLKTKSSVATKIRKGSPKTSSKTTPPSSTTTTIATAIFRTTTTIPLRSSTLKTSTPTSILKTTSGPKLSRTTLVPKSFSKTSKPNSETTTIRKSSPEATSETTPPLSTATTISIMANPICTNDQFTCVSSKQCVSRTLVCDGKPDCQQHEDEQSCVRYTTVQPASAQTDNKKSSTIIITIVVVVVIFVFAVIPAVIVVLRKKRERYDLRMMYETQQDLQDSRDTKAKPDIEVGKYFTNPFSRNRTKKSENFENVNFSEMNELKAPLQMAEMNDFMKSSDDYSSSSDLCFDDSKPMLSDMV